MTALRAVTGTAPKYRYAEPTYNFQDLNRLVFSRHSAASRKSKGDKTMTRHKTISSLSIGAIALLAATAPSFAPTQPDQSGIDTQCSVATPAMEQTIASNRELTTVNRSRAGVTEVERTNARTASSFRLPANAFKVPNHFTSAEASRFVTGQMTFLNAGP